MNFRSLEEFWPFYMSQHSKPSTRRWHFAGTLCSILFLMISVLFNWWFLIPVPLIGYGFAWYSHFFVEGNVPATFGHPIWSFLCDYKMFGLMLTGQMDREIKRLVPLFVLVATSTSWSNLYLSLAKLAASLLTETVTMKGRDGMIGLQKNQQSDYVTQSRHQVIDTGVYPGVGHGS